MQQTYKNLCFRCGKERIVVRKWTEKFESGVVTTTQNRCPDKACQDIINEELEAQKQKRELMEKHKIERLQARKREKKKK